MTVWGYFWIFLQGEKFGEPFSRAETDVLPVKFAVKNVHDSNILCTCLGHLGRRNTDRIISMCVPSPKVAKASTVVRVSFPVSAGMVLILITNLIIIFSSITN